MKDRYYTYKFRSNAGYINPNYCRTRFNTSRALMPYHALSNTIGYVFITKPILNIFEEGSQGTKLSKTVSQVFYYDNLLKSDTELFRCLQAYQGNSSPFITPLFEKCKSISNEDVVMEVSESANSAGGWKTFVAGGNFKSFQGQTVNLDFVDDRYLTVYKLLYIWGMYMDAMKSGELSPNEIFIQSGKLDYASTIYEFLTAEDGKTIIYAAQYVGAFPLCIPDSSFSWTRGGQQDIDYSIPFQYAFKNTSPTLFKDFQKISPRQPGGKVLTMNDPTWAKNVFIEEKHGGIYEIHFTE